jgi:hypothetical protein
MCYVPCVAEANGGAAEGDSVMDEFVYAGGWFDHYRKRLGYRYPTFKVALNILLQQGGRNIVETGSLRNPTNWLGDGCSTLLLGEFAAAYGRHLWTCDIDESVIATAMRATAEFAASVTFICGDSVAFLGDFTGPIDLLYLDSFDCPPSGDATAAQQHNLRELMAAFPHLSSRAIVLLDDNLWSNGGKTCRSKEYLRDAGWLCLLDTAQSLWLNPSGLALTCFTPVGRFDGR